MIMDRKYNLLILIIIFLQHFTIFLNNIFSFINLIYLGNLLNIAIALY